MFMWNLTELVHMLVFVDVACVIYLNLAVFHGVNLLCRGS